jgi:YegS/Rv2252/BmrU family lipid kinase
MTTNWFAVANPAAGGGRDVAAIAARLRRSGLAHDLACSDRAGHAVELAAAAARAGARHFLAIGGDGTLHDLVNGVLGSGAVSAAEATFGLLPLGRGNDWARTHGIPGRLDLALEVLSAGRTLEHDVGTVMPADGRMRYFINAAGVGFDAHVVRRTLGRRMGKLSYLASLPASLLTYRAPELVVHAEGHHFAGRAFMAFASINRYCGGGMLVAPSALCDDGLLDVMVLGEISLAELALNVGRLYDGTLPAHPKVRTFRTPVLEVSGPRPVEAEADGELIGTSPIRFGLLPRHIRVIVP